MPLARLHNPALANGEKIATVDLLGGGSFPMIAGRIFWVKPSTDTDYAKFFADHNVVEDGTNSVYNTIDAAISACTAGRGDVIYVVPGHTETVTATSIALDVAGVTVIGLGNEDLRPTLTFGAAAATITVTGANCAWKNCRFLANFQDVAAAFTIGAAKGFTLDGNHFYEGSSVLNFLSIVVTGATDNEADRLTITNNYYRGQATSPNAFISILAAETGVFIKGNDVFMAATNNVGHFITLSTKVMTAIRIIGNSLTVVGATTATVGIFLTGSGSSTGLMAYNLVSSLDTTTELIITASTGIAQFENYYTGTADASGKLWPVVDAA